MSHNSIRHEIRKLSAAAYNVIFLKGFLYGGAVGVLIVLTVANAHG